MQCSRSVKWHDAHKNAEQQKQLLFSRHQWSLPTEGVWGELKVNGHIGLSYSHVHIGPNAATMAWYTLLSRTNLPGNILGNLLPSKKTVQQSWNHSIEGEETQQLDKLFSLVTWQYTAISWHDECGSETVPLSSPEVTPDRASHHKGHFYTSSGLATLSYEEKQSLKKSMKRWLRQTYANTHVRTHTPALYMLPLTN